MTNKIGYDAINWSAIPADAEYVFLYNDANYAAPAAAYQHFAALGIPVATIAAYPTTVANVLDVETGNIVTPANPAGAVQWAKMMRAEYNYTGVIYCNASSQAAIAAEFTRQGVSQPLWSIADLVSEAPVNFGPGVVNVQWAFKNQYDVNAVAPDFPTIGGKVAVPPSATTPVASSTPVSNLDTEVAARARSNTRTPIATDGAAGANTWKALQFVLGVTVDGNFGPNSTKQLQADLNAGVLVVNNNMAAATHNTFTPLTVDGAFGPKTVKAFQTVLGVTPDGVFGKQSVTVMQRALNAGLF